jgi:uncharacterized protein with HEPN domain
MKRENGEILFDIKESIELIFQYTANINYKDFEDLVLIKDAVIRRFEVISDACKLLSNDLKERVDFIPWERIIDIKIKLVNDDFEINAAKVWEIVKEDLPILKDDITKVIDEINQNVNKE